MRGAPVRHVIFALVVRFEPYLLVREAMAVRGCMFANATPSNLLPCHNRDLACARLRYLWVARTITSVVLFLLASVSNDRG